MLVEHVEVVKRWVPSWGGALLNHEVAISLMIVGLVAFLQRTNHGEKTEPSREKESSSSASIGDIGNSSIQNSSDISQSNKQESHTHIHLSEPQDAPPSVAPEPHPHIERLDIRSATIVFTNEPRYKWVENIAGYSAMIIEFRNKYAAVGEEASTAKDVVARLIFTPRNAKRVVTNAACWLDAVLQGAIIEPGEVRKLVIAVDLQPGSHPYTLYNPREILPIYYSHYHAQKERPPAIQTFQLSAIRAM